MGRLQGTWENAEGGNCQRGNRDNCSSNNGRSCRRRASPSLQAVRKRALAKNLARLIRSAQICSKFLQTGLIRNVGSAVTDLIRNIFQTELIRAVLALFF